MPFAEILIDLELEASRALRRGAEGVSQIAERPDGIHEAERPERDYRAL